MTSVSSACWSVSVTSFLVVVEMAAATTYKEKNVAGYEKVVEVVAVRDVETDDQIGKFFFFWYSSSRARIRMILRPSSPEQELVTASPAGVLQISVSTSEQRTPLIASFGEHGEDGGGDDGDDDDDDAAPFLFPTVPYLVHQDLPFSSSPQLLLCVCMYVCMYP